MTKSYELALHIFRRDLRLQDNTALIEALKTSQYVIPCFIFDKRQIEVNDYKSDNCVQFMLNSLQELAQQISGKNGNLYFFHGIAEDVIGRLLEELPIDAVFINRDYTPFSVKRDQQIEKICKQQKIALHCFADALLHEPEQIHKPNHTPYTIFTHFYNRAQEILIAPAQKNTLHNYYQQDIAFADKKILAKLQQYNNPNLFLQGGRQEGINLLKNIKNFKNYQETRDFPAMQGTTKLSTHHKFGTVSIRESYQQIVNHFGKQHTLVRELYWRDFFTHIAWHFPRVFGHAFHDQYDRITWSKNEKHFRAWCEGRTGFPIVDAGMRELNTTGYMHNRVRMVVASFLTKDLHIDWRWGEKYFAQKLIDYDPAVNNGNWQWGASTGCDAQPYFRIFNPWLQQEKFDTDCLYIKQWIPELSTLAPKIIHGLATNKTKLMTNYPEPIIDHAEESKKSKLIYNINT